MRRRAPSGRWRRLGVAVQAGAVVAVLAGCGASAAGSGKVPLIVYAAEGYDASTVAAFQTATGIQTKLTDDSTGPLLSKIQAEKNNPQWGLVWVDGDEPFAALDQQNYLLKGWEPNVSFSTAAQKLLPSDKSYIITGYTVMAPVVYQSSVVTTPPTSWSDLLQPQWKDAVGMDNPSVSGPTYPFVAGLMQYMGGVSQGEQYFSQLKANGLKIYDTNKPTLAALTSGAIKIALVQNSAAIGAELATPSLGLKEAYLNPQTVLPSVIGIDSRVSAQEQAEAEQFVNFVFSSKGENARQTGDPQGDSLFWPAENGLSPLPAVPDFSSIPYQVLNASQWGPKQNTIDTWFTNNIVQ